MMRKEFFEFYLFLRSWFVPVWIATKERQAPSYRLYLDWDNQKEFYALSKFNSVASLLFCEIFDEEVPLTVDRWFLNTAYFGSDEESRRFVLELQDRLTFLIELEEGRIDETSNKQ